MDQLHPAGGRPRLHPQEERRPVFRAALAADSQGHSGCRPGARRGRCQGGGSGSPPRQSRRPKSRACAARPKSKAESKPTAYASKRPRRWPRSRPAPSRRSPRRAKPARLDLRRYSAGLALSLAETQDCGPPVAASPGQPGERFRGPPGPYAAPRREQLEYDAFRTRLPIRQRPGGCGDRPQVRRGPAPVVARSARASRKSSPVRRNCATP